MGLTAKGRYIVRFAADKADLLAAQRLRQRVFRPERGGADIPGDTPAGTDSDRFDDLCRHVLVEDQTTGALVCCFRLMQFDSSAGLEASYAAQFYDLSALRRIAGPMLEIGRFCTDPGRSDPDILRLAWACLTRIVDAERTRMLFGCSSFRGADPARHTDALALLARHHLAPEALRPRIRAAEVWRYGEMLAGRNPDPVASWMAMPPLLRSYLAMGGWVSDHAVIDRDLNTLHVFTGLEVSAIPPSRARLLRAIASQTQVAEPADL